MPSPSRACKPQWVACVWEASMSLFVKFLQAETSIFCAPSVWRVRGPLRIGYRSATRFLHAFVWKAHRHLGQCAGDVSRPDVLSVHHLVWKVRRRNTPVYRRLEADLGRLAAWSPPT